MSIETKTTSFITTAPSPPTMSTKAPAPVITSSSSSSTQSHSSTVTSVPSAVLNNNNNISAAATSIITAPLMSQSQPVINTLQKQTTSNVSVTTTDKPTVTTSTGISPTAIKPTTGPVSCTSTASSVTPPTSTAITSKPGVGTTVSSGGVNESKTTTVTGSTPITPPVSTSTCKPSTTTTGVLQPQTKPAEGNKSPTTPSVLPLTKPVDANKGAMMNGGATAVMKQPPPPVTILPPTPAATPPPVHRQPPSLPKPQSTPPTAASTNANVTVNNVSNSQKSQPANPPLPTSANNTAVKQSSAPAPTTPSPQKIQNQEKPTQALPPQHQVSSTSSPAHKQGIQPKDQQPVQSGNQDQKVINSSVTSSVTKTATTIPSGPTTTPGSVSTAVTISSPPPAATTASADNNIINKNIVQSISRPATVTNTSNSAVSTTKIPTSTTTVTGKKMENTDILQLDKPLSGAPESKDVKLDSQPSSLSNLGGGDAQILNSECNNTKASSDLKTNETDKTFFGSHLDNKTASDSADMNQDSVAAKNALNKMETPSKVDQKVVPKEKTSNLSRPSTAVNGGKKEEIGEDVKRIMEAIENAGLCGPKQPDSSLEYEPKSNISNSSGEAGKGKGTRGSMTSKLTRPSTGSKVQSLRPATAASPTKNANASSPTKPRPATASTASKKAPAAGQSNLQHGSPALTLPPKSATSGVRTSTSRVASARGNTAPTAKTPNDNKNTKAKANGADSCSVSPVDTENKTSSATGSRSTSRVLRPSSSLYRPTASSALKGVSSAPHNSTSNHNLHSSSPSTPRTSRSSTGPRTTRSIITMGDSAGGSGDGKPATIRDQFTAFSRFGNKDEDGKHITLSNCDKWMKQAKVIDGKKITTTDTSICFKKLFKTAKKITFEDFKKYVEELAKGKKIEPQEILDKLANSGPPGLSSATRAAHSNVVDRLTDTSKYTGSHKERFDNSGKGRGIEGRKDVSDGSGYVAAFKEKLDLKDGDPKKEDGSSSPTPAK
ncbi:unnamed protein product [Orchesella dallaii]|uniref:Tubulin polymerization-promoting protein family member 3 n=1 Tax=Orchesella dallaii TaxID=48710 RepID=A0ABP1RNF3_9HEXA